MSTMRSRRIYIGNLPGDVREEEIEDLFYKYGKIVDIDLKVPRHPPGYCFLEYEDARDAEDAIRGRDGYDFDGHRLRVEIARAASDRSRSTKSTRAVPRCSEYRVNVTGLPPSASWQDLKDHMRSAGDVSFAQVFRDGSGIVDFTNYEDMQYAIRKLDDSKFRNPFSRSYIRVKEDRGSGSRRSVTRSRSRSPRSVTPLSRSLSRSVRSASISRSPSVVQGSVEKKDSRSPSFSRSKSPVSSDAEKESRLSSEVETLDRAIERSDSSVSKDSQE